jgi:hypothetical protein
MVRFSSFCSVLCLLLGFISPAQAQYNTQNFDGYISGLIGPRETPTGIYNQFQRGLTHDFQCVYSRATSYDQNTASFHWTKPATKVNNKPFTNYVIIAAVGAPRNAYSTAPRDYWTNYINDIPTPFPAGNGTISPASEVVRRTPYACPACGPTEPRKYYVLKVGSYLNNDTTAVLTNAVVGQRYIITRYDYVADASGIPTNLNPIVFPTFYTSLPIALTIPHATPRISGIVADAAGQVTVTWNMAVEDPTAAHGYTVRMTEDDSVATNSIYMAGLNGHRNRPFAVGFEKSAPAGYRATTSALVPAATAPASATYSYTFDRTTDITVRPGHYYSYQVTSTDNSLGNNSDDSDTSPIVDGVSGGLPVRLVSFTVNRLAAGVRLAWATDGETGVTGFEVQRSLDRLSWTKVGYVAGNGTSATPQLYTFTDTNGAPAYYRLAQVNAAQVVQTYTGPQYAAAGVLATKTASGTLDLTLFPNPAHGTVQLTGTNPSQPLQLVNALGQLVQEFPAGTVQLQVGQQPTGIYVVRQGAQRVRLVLQ